MTPERLQELISHGETLLVEFKAEEKNLLSDTELVEAVVCLANNRLGREAAWLLIGVEDNGRVTGARDRHRGRTDLRQLQALIANRTRPSLACRIEAVPLKEKHVIAIEVPISRVPIGTADGKYMRRALGGRGVPECVPFHFHEMQALQADRGILDYSALSLSEASWQDLDPLEFERFRRAIRESRGQGDAALLDLSDMELAKALGAVEANHSVTQVRVLALLLFGKEDALRRFLPTHEVAVQVLANTQVVMNDFFRWPVLRTMEEVLSRFRARNREEEILVGLQRVGIPLISERAFREALANACIHRDYTRLGAVHLHWHSDRIEISNPGGFPEGVRLDNLLVTPPRPRNPLLADACKRAGVVERTGRGIDTLFFEQLRNGRRAPSYQQSTQTDVVLVLPSGQTNLALVRLLVEEEQAGRPLGLDALLLLYRLQREGRLTLSEATALLQKSEEDARAVFDSLGEVGLVEQRGKPPRHAYDLSAAARLRLGGEAVSPSPALTPAHQERLVLQYAEEHGSISRMQASSLCQLSKPQAYRLLQRLVHRGLLTVTTPTGRNVRYRKKQA